MKTDLEPLNSTTTTTTTGKHLLSPPSLNDYDLYIDESNCSTPYVSAPSSPGRVFPTGVGFFYSAPASPMHYVLAGAPVNVSLATATSDASSGSFEFEFSSRFSSPAREICPSMSSADELFLNGQIRPMKLSAHLQRPQALAPLIDLENEINDDDDDDNDVVFKRSRLRDRSQRRRTRSLSPLRSSSPFDWFSTDDDVVSTKLTPEMQQQERVNDGDKKVNNTKERENETTPSGSASSSRCSSAGRSSKRWIFLKDFLRSKSEGRSNNKFWQNISFSPAKEKKPRNANTTPFQPTDKTKTRNTPATKRRSAHEMHYAANRAQAEEMRKKTFLPYRQGLLGCLGFNSKSYGALNGFARALNPVSSS